MKNTDLAKLKLKAVRVIVDRHAKGPAMVAAGKAQRDSLLRALIPLYAARDIAAHFRNGVSMRDELVTSGVTQAFWRGHRVKVQATVMAKALPGARARGCRSPRTA